MRVVLDTNIFIYREDHSVIPAELQNLLRVLNKLGASILLHPRSLQDIDRDPNVRRREIVRSKAMSYPILEVPPTYENDLLFSQAVRDTSDPNDKVDNSLLYAVYRNSVNFLVTEDKQMLRKAKLLRIGERVLSIAEARKTFEALLPNELVRHPWALRDDYVYNLDVADSFFDSLKQEYPEFVGWFNGIASQGRRCWVYTLAGRIGALLIYKIEDENIDVLPAPLAKQKRLKLCTFKVGYTGYKIGELLIKLAVQYAINNGLSEIYLTHFTKSAHDELFDLITEYGFLPIGKNRRGENVFLKDLMPSAEKVAGLMPTEISKRYWPCFCDGPDVRKFVVPIKPVYHDRLFVELKERPTLFEMAGEFVVEGNTIKKAYLCHSKSKRLVPGSLLFFYRSHYKQALTAFGVVESVYDAVSRKEIVLDAIDKRTVYSDAEVTSILSKPATILLFTWHFYLPRSIAYGDLLKLGVLSAAPQSISEISHDAYIRLRTDGGIDERFAFN
jgi:predicted nucleic acid-binding protein